MKPGIYSGITNAEYHGGVGVSKSMLDVLAQSSPLHLHHLRSSANDNERAPTPAQMIGTAFHSLLLEPEQFYGEYCMALRPQDVPDAIDDREVLAAMVQELNKGRLAKLPTSGNKDDLVARIKAAEESSHFLTASPEGFLVQMDEWRGTLLEGMKAAELKSVIERLNASRPGLLPIGGTRHELAEVLRANGKPVTLWSDVKDEWQRNNGHRTVLPPEQWEQLHNMRAAVHAHPAASALLFNHSGARAELSVYWSDPKTGELCRCRPDWWREDGVIVDLKTTEDASPEGFARSIANWRYHVQHAYYVDGITEALKQASERNLAGWNPQPPRAFVFLAVEKSACVVDGKAMGVAVYVLDGDSVELGRLIYRADLDRYAQCAASGVWPGYGDKIQPIKLPAYEFTKNAHLIGAA